MSDKKAAPTGTKALRPRRGAKGRIPPHFRDLDAAQSKTMAAYINSLPSHCPCATCTTHRQRLR